MNANMSYLALGEKEGVYLVFGHSAPVVSLETSDNNIRGLSQTRMLDSQAEVSLARGCQNQITACPFRVCTGHVVPFSAKMAVDTRRQRARCWAPGPSCHYNTLHD